MRFYVIFLICIFGIGCATLLTEQTYVRIDTPVTISNTRDGIAYTFPEKKLVRKIRILGEGAIQNIGIWGAKPAKDMFDGQYKYRWILIKEIKKKMALPIDIKIPIAPPTEVIQITTTHTAKSSYKGRVPIGQIEDVEFYTTVSKDQ